MTPYEKNYAAINFWLSIRYLMSSLSPYGKKSPSLTEILGHHKGQLLAQYIIFLHVHNHPMLKSPTIIEILGQQMGQRLALYTMFLRVNI